MTQDTYPKTPFSKRLNRVNINGIWVSSQLNASYAYKCGIQNRHPILTRKCFHMDLHRQCRRPRRCQSTVLHCNRHRTPLSL